MKDGWLFAAQSAGGVVRSAVVAPSPASTWTTLKPFGMNSFAALPAASPPPSTNCVTLEVPSPLLRVVAKAPVMSSL